MQRCEYLFAYICMYSNHKSYDSSKRFILQLHGDARRSVAHVRASTSMNVPK